MSTFITAYRNETKRFTAPGLTQPVIILYDSDTGAEGIRKAIGNVSKVKPTGAEPFVHIIKNLYAVPIPLGVGTTTSTIEDLFDASIKATKIDGKTFNPGAGFDAQKHYSKKVFAHKVVRPNAGAINFTAFRSLLSNLTAAISKHRGF